MTEGFPGGESMMSCPRCRRPNPVWLIYCGGEDCAAVLYPGRAACGSCLSDIPVNARFCPRCGQQTGFENHAGIPPPG